MSGPQGKMTKAARQFAKVFEEHRGEKHVIAIRGYPDPDSIGSAMAHQYISQHYDIESVILYFDDISHSENRALVKKLAIEMIRYSKQFDLGAYNHMAVVDAQTVELPDEIEALPMLSIVDHHKIQGDFKAEFVDIRDNAGSTCSMYSEYLQSGLAPMDSDDVDISRIASALVYGIRTDTDNYLTARELDYKAAAYLAPFADHDLLMAISTQNISPRTMEITQKAFANKVISDTYMISGVGFVRDEDRDGIGQAADYLLRREGIDTVLVYGVVNNQFIDGSMRTTSDTVDPDRFLKEAFGNDSHGIPFGGGRTEKGAFKIPLGPFAHCSDRKLLWSVVQHTIEDLFFDKLGTTREEQNLPPTPPA